MNNFEKDLAQIRYIRSLRSDSAKRKQLACEQKRQAAKQHIIQAEADLVHLEEEVITLQRESLSALVNGSLVKVETLMNFNRDKLKNLKRVVDAKVELNQFIHRKHEADVQFEASRTLAIQAEKKLIGIDEVITNKPWT